MAYEFVLTERDGPVGIVTINRPRQLNALSSAVLTEIAHALEAHDADPAIRVLILTGGTEVFAAGADLKEFASQSIVEMLAGKRVELFDKVRGIGKPVIAAVSGYALGGGCELAMLCDMIVASETAKFGQPEISVGLMPGAGGTQRLARTIGKAKTMELVLTGVPIDAPTAEQLGLVNRVVPVDQLVDEAKSLAQKIASKPPISVRHTKQAVLKAFELPLSEAVEYERTLFYLLFGTEDAREGMNAFIEKRRPSFKGE
jgi:enoyl-CoA hydratase